MSLICPAVCHGSLVIRTSPGASLSGGNAARKCFIDVAMALICPGVPLSDCAIIRPLVSNKPQAKSWLSRTIVLKAVRMSVSCCSLATDMKRFQITSSVTGSIALFSIAQLHDNVQSIIHPRMPAPADDQRRFALLDNRRSGELHARLERIAIVDQGFNDNLHAPGNRRAASLCARRFARRPSRGSFSFHSGRGPLATTRQLITSNGTSGPLRPYNAR